MYGFTHTELFHICSLLLWQGATYVENDIHKLSLLSCVIAEVCVTMLYTLQFLETG
jgi:hypothetical protein